jgi:hypothetical protein
MGFYNSMGDYWTHYGPSAESARANTSCAGIDMSNNTGARNASGMYAAPTKLAQRHVLVGDLQLKGC